MNKYHSMFIVMASMGLLTQAMAAPTSSSYQPQNISMTPEKIAELKEDLDDQASDHVIKAVLKGVDINTRIDSSGKSILMAAIFSSIETAVEDSQWTLPCVLMLLGANVNQPDYQKITPLMLASNASDHEAVNHAIIFIRMLLERHAQINAQDANGWTALRWAIEATRNDEAPNVDLIRFLLETKGIQPDLASDETYQGDPSFSPKGTTPLLALSAELPPSHLSLADLKASAAPSNEDDAKTLKIMTLLIKHHANVNVQSVNGHTPLLNAIQADNLWAVQLLIQNHAQIRDNDIHMVLSQLNNENLAKYLLDHAPNSVLKDSPWLGLAIQYLYSDDVIRQLIARGAALNPNYPVNREYISPMPLESLIDSPRKDILPLMKLLVENGADVNTRYSWQGYITPLGLAKKRGDPKIINYLISHGATTKIMNQPN
jgi:ankyrin repeat protein